MELSKNKMSLYSSLQRGKMRKRHALFVVEGRKSVADTLPYFTAEAIIVRKGEEFEGVSQGTPMYEATTEQLRQISGLSTPADVMAVYKIPETDGEIPEIASDRLYMLLDGIQDPGNMGTIIRTCHWFGIFDIFASNDTVDIYNPKVVQSTMGSIAKVRVTYCDLKELIERNPELPVYGTLLEGIDIFKAPLEKRGFIIMGNEGNGISAELRPMITSPLLIPPAGPDHSESLNVAVATAITVAQFMR